MAGEEPVEDVHYKKVRTGDRTCRWVCKIIDCTENAASIVKFNEHLVDHGLLPIRKPAKKPKANAESSQPKPPSVDYVRLRGTLAARWRINKRRKWQKFMEKSNVSASLLAGERPKPVEESLLSVLLDATFRMTEHSSSLYWLIHDDANLDLQCEYLKAGEETNLVVDWTDEVLEYMNKQVEPWPDTERQVLLSLSIKALKSLFPWGEESPQVKKLFAPLRKHLLYTGVEYLEWKHADDEWRLIMDVDLIEQKTLAKYLQWKITNKDKVLEKLRKNLLQTYTQDFKMSVDEAVTMGGLDDSMSESEGAPSDQDEDDDDADDDDADDPNPNEPVKVPAVATALDERVNHVAVGTAQPADRPSDGIGEENQNSVAETMDDAVGSQVPGSQPSYLQSDGNACTLPSIIDAVVEQLLIPTPPIIPHPPTVNLNVVNRPRTRSSVRSNK